MASPNPQPPKKGHTRTISTDERRVTIPRRRTKGPLDLGDPPFAAPPRTPTPTRVSTMATPPTLQTRDLTFLLHPTNFHPLPTSTLLPPFLSAPAPPPYATPASLLNSFHFRAAAISAATQLTAAPPPADNATILSLWYTRLLALTLASSTPLAAMEIKVFQDLTSSFYLDPSTGRSILPWELRVLAISLGNDPRRAVGAYYELAAECRNVAMDASVDEGERRVWRARLEELAVRVANALVQMGDYAAAGRHLRGLRHPRREAMLALLYIRAGMIDEASEVAGDDEAMKGLLLMAEGDWEGAAALWAGMQGEMARSNEAVCELYMGHLEKARMTLEGLVDEGIVFPGMIFNLSTVYELCGDTSKSLKLQLAEKVAALGREFTNPSFKM